MNQFSKVNLIAHYMSGDYDLETILKCCVIGGIHLDNSIENAKGFLSHHIDCEIEVHICN